MAGSPTRGEVGIGTTMLVDADVSKTNSSYYYPIPDGGRAISASVTIGPAPFDGLSESYPYDLVFNVGGGTVEYYYTNQLQMEGYDNGFWGYQNRMKGGEEYKYCDLRDPAQGAMYFILPKNITVREAVFNITGHQRSSEWLDYHVSPDLFAEDYGHSVRGMGDLDQVAGEEVLISAPRHTELSRTVGAVYMLDDDCLEAGLEPILILTGTKDQCLFGTHISDRFSLPDKREAFAVGAPRDGTSSSGMVHIYTASMAPVNVVGIEGKYPLQDFGTWFEIGDIEGDGDNELVVGAPSNDSGRGAVYFYDMIYNSTSGNIEIEDLYTIDGPATDSSFGRTMSAGDFNDDTYTDLAVAGDDFIYLYLGGPSADLDADATFFPKLMEQIDYFSSVEFIGDVVGTGGDTLAVGCPKENMMGTSGGYVLLYGGDSSLDEFEDFTLTSTALDSQNFGLAVDRGMDIDGDGYEEFAISAGGNSGSPGATAVYTRNNLGQVVMMNGLDGHNAGGSYGRSIDLGPDIKRDTYGDLFVGSPKQGIGGNSTIWDRFDTDALPSNRPGMKIGTTTVWTHEESHLSGYVRTDDLSSSFNQALASANIYTRDLYNDYCQLGVTLTSQTNNPIEWSTLFNVTEFSIEYDYEVELEDITGPMNNYLRNPSNLEDGTFRVPFRMGSETDGGLTIVDLDVELDLPPVILAPPENVYTIEEDGRDPRLLDLWAVFDDDRTNDHELMYLISRADGNTSRVIINITDGRFVNVDAATPKDGDNWTGEVSFAVYAIDEEIYGLDGRTRTEFITVKVLPVNDPPGLIEGIFPPTTGVQGQPYEFREYAIDVESDEILYSVDGPPGMEVDENGRVYWVPSNDDVGTVNWTLELSDGKDMRQVTFTVEVANVNDPPFFTDLPPVYNDIYLGETFQYDIEAVEIDKGDEVTFMMTVPLGANWDSRTGEISWEPKETYDQPIGFTVTIEDEEKASVSYTFYVNVTKRLFEPEFNSTPDLAISDMVPWVYSLEIFDRNGEYTITLAEAPEGMKYDDITDNITWTPDVDQVEIYNVSIRLESYHFVVYQNFTLNVFRSDRTWDVVYLSPEDGEKVRGTVTITGTASVEPSTISWIEIDINGDGWKKVNLTGETYSYTFDTNEYPDGDLTLRIRAFDGADYSDVITVTLKVDNEGEKTSLLLVILIVLLIVLILGGAGGAIFLFLRLQKKNEEEKEKREKLEEIQRSKEEIDQFIEKEVGGISEERLQQIMEEGSREEDVGDVLGELVGSAEVRSSQASVSLMGTSDHIAVLPGEEGYQSPAPQELPSDTEQQAPTLQEDSEDQQESYLQESGPEPPQEAGG